MSETDLQKVDENKDLKPQETSPMDIAVTQMNEVTTLVVESAYLSNDERMINYKDKVKAFIKKPIDLNILESIIRRVEQEINHPLH